MELGQNRFLFAFSLWIENFGNWVATICFTPLLIFEKCNFLQVRLNLKNLTYNSDKRPEIYQKTVWNIFALSKIQLKFCSVPAVARRRRCCACANPGLGTWARRLQRLYRLSAEAHQLYRRFAIRSACGYIPVLLQIVLKKQQIYLFEDDLQNELSSLFTFIGNQSSWFSVLRIPVSEKLGSYMDHVCNLRVSLPGS